MSIVPTVLVYQEYTLYQPEKEWNHEEFTVETQYIEHFLCGDLVYYASFMGEAIATNEPALSYDGQT